MTDLPKIQRFRRYLKFKTKAVKQIASDLWLTAPAVFIVTGIITACFKFWAWAFSWL